MYECIYVDIILRKKLFQKENENYLYVSLTFSWPQTDKYSFIFFIIHLLENRIHDNITI